MSDQVACVEYLGHGFAVLRCGFSIHELDNDVYICIHRDTMRELLALVFRLYKRWNDRNDFVEWLKRMFSDFFISGDMSFCAPLGIKLWEILVEWDRFMKEQRIKHFYNEIGDCDDFARMFQEFVVFRFRMNTLGRLWGLLYGEEDGKEVLLGGHAYNWVVLPIDCDYDRVEVQVKGVEPQLSAAMLPDNSGAMVLPLTNFLLRYVSYTAFG